MIRYHKLSVLARMMMVASAALALLASSGWFGGHGQVPSGDRQPRAADVPKELPQKKSREEIALERALNNICRGCLPVIPVRNVPRYNLGRTCPAREGSDRCRNDEETMRQKVTEQWTTFTQKARSDCVQANEIGGRPSYVQLGICLKTVQIAPTLPESGSGL
jgi:hypothetical protein